MRFLALAACVAASSAAVLVGAADERRVVWFDAAATHFTESSPLGNGRIGAMVFGGVQEERIVLNESGMWSGSPQEADRPDAAAALPKIRRLLLEGRNAEAEKLLNEKFTCAGAGSGKGVGANVPFGCYQTLGDLRLKFVHAGADEPAARYRRELDLTEAVARITYEQGGVTFTRESFVSAPDQVLAIRLTASRPGAISFDAALARPERSTTVASGSDGLLMTGQLNNGVDGKGVKFAARMRAVARGGTVTTRGNSLEVRDADEVVLLFSALTDIRTFAGRRADDPAAATTADLAKVEAKNFETLRKAHVADHRSYFDRVSLRLGAATSVSLTTPQRLHAFRAGTPDADLAALYFDFGRYLLISSSRPGGLPGNLQGIWAEQIQTPWNGDWHLNINVQMNYWHAEVCGLSELHEPLFALINSLQVPGAKTARSYYGANGWVAHVITNPWGFTSPGESASWGATSSGSAWLVQHLWDHFLFTGDRDFLKRAYPAMKSSAQFYLDMLIEEPKHRWLVTAPSNSPENAFRLPDGSAGHICLGSTCDMQLVRYLFAATEQASRLLGVDAELRQKLEQARGRLAPTRIGQDGRIMEWLEEYEEVDPHHRHVAHLWGLYPGNEITPAGTPHLAVAARKTLDRRGDAGTGWGLAFKLALWARLGDGERAHTILREHLKPATLETAKKRWSGGTFANLFDSHPPFQIDGNFGGTAAISEMLLQSHTGEIALLPALPAAWSEGEFRGLKARGGFEISATWRDGTLVRAVIHSDRGGKVRVRYAGRDTEASIPAGGSVELDKNLARR